MCAPNPLGKKIRRRSKKNKNRLARQPIFVFFAARHATNL
jgi:hypothetical protein